jgi:uncharacterized membrane protein
MASASPLRRRRRLRAGSLLLLLTAAGVGLGLGLPPIGSDPQVPARQVTDMLVTLGFGVLSVTAVIFSVLFLVVQWAHTSFTPRLTLFRDAPIVWRTVAFVVGLAAYCFTAALTIGTSPHTSLAVPVVAGVLLLAMLALLRTLQVQAFAAVQLAPVLRSITTRGRGLLDTLHAAADPRRTDLALPPVSSSITWTKPLAVLQQVDTVKLLAAAHTARAVVVLHAIPGATLRTGTPLATVHGADLPAGAVLDALVTGDERVFEQDPLLAFRLLADITLRALSPAVNDPATAVQALDCLEDLLTGPAAAQTGGPLQLAGPDGTARLLLEFPGWPAYLRTGLDDVIAAAGNSPMVLFHLRALLTRLNTGEHEDHRALLASRLSWVEAELAGRFPTLWQEAAPDPASST